MTVARGRGAGFRSAGQKHAGSAIADTVQPPSDGSPPDWEAVEQLISFLARTRAVFPTTVSPSNWISAYEPGRRLMVESGSRSGWVQLEHVRACWKTFERLGRISAGDVLEPGRRSTFIMGLFAQLAGVRRDEGREPSLVLPTAQDGTGTTGAL